MKKLIIVSFFAFMMVSSALSIVYFMIERKIVKKNFIKNLTHEVQKKYPKIGYTFSITRDGTIIDHPLHNVKNKKIESLIATSEKKRILNALSGLKKDESLLISKSKDQFGHSIELFFRENNEQIQGLLFFPSELTKFIATHERHTLIAISLLLLLFFCCMLILFALFFIAFPHGWWIIIILISCAMVIEIGYLWSLRDSVGLKENLQDTPLLTKAQEANFFENIESITNQKITTIPTGIFIENVQFSMQTSDIYPGVFLTGYIWQRYDKKIHEGIDREFILPNAYDITLKELYRTVTPDEEKICWSFSCCLYQIFNPRLYPLDHRHITINMIHKNFDKNIALTPDFESFETINPILLPGLASQSITPSHWNVVKSYFTYKKFDYKTSLGSSTFFYQEAPYLQFIINTQRKLGGNFIMYFILLVVVLIILFILLMAFLQETTLSVLTACSALLFVLITSEINLRQTLKTEGIVYLEFLYFICYIVIISVIINNIVFTQKKNIKIIKYGDNLLIKMLYWPITLCAIVTVTALMFY